MIAPQPAPASASINPRKLRCGCSFPAAASGQLPRWSTPNVSYFTRITLPGLTAQQVDRAFEAAANSWTQICGINFRRSGTTWANISAQSGRIDGRFGTLAYSYMPGANEPMSTSLPQVYDAGEQWTEKFLQEVVAHELGHAIGIGHSDDVEALMYPFSDGRTVSPQEWDIQEALRRYPVSAPKPPDPPRPPDPPVVVPSGKLLFEIVSVDRKRIQIWEVV